VVVEHVADVVGDEIEDAMLRGAHPLADTELEAAVAEVVEHDHLFGQPDRVVARDDVDERAELDSLGQRRQCGEQEAWRRCCVEGAQVMLGGVITPQSSLVGRPGQLDVLGQHLPHRCLGCQLHVIDQSEPHRPSLITRDFVVQHKALTPRERGGTVWPWRRSSVPGSR
jgi:hypothetical protein